MTPQRETYLAKCNEREKYLRELIALCEKMIKHFKWALNNHKTFNDEYVKYTKNLFAIISGTLPPTATNLQGSRGGRELFLCGMMTAKKYLTQ